MARWKKYTPSTTPVVDRDPPASFPAAAAGGSAFHQRLHEWLHDNSGPFGAEEVLDELPPDGNPGD